MLSCQFLLQRPEFPGNGSLGFAFLFFGGTCHSCCDSRRPDDAAVALWLRTTTGAGPQREMSMLRSNPASGLANYSEVDVHPRPRGSLITNFG